MLQNNTSQRMSQMETDVNCKFSAGITQNSIILDDFPPPREMFVGRAGIKHCRNDCLFFKWTDHDSFAANTLAPLPVDCREIFVATISKYTGRF